MSNNPFEKPVEEQSPYSTPYDTNAPGVPESIPTGVMVCAIIGLILGLLGLLGSCSGTAMLFASDLFINVLPDEESKEAMKKMLSIQFLPALVQSVVGLVASLLLVVASIGCLTRKPWGADWMRLAMMACILSGLISLGVNIWTTVFHADIMSAPNAAQMGEGPAKQVFYFSQVIGMLIIAVSLGFYIFGAIYFGKEKVKGFFERQSDRLRKSQ